MRDAFVKLNSRFAQYVRHFADGVEVHSSHEDHDDREVKGFYYTISNTIAGELNKMVRDLINELKNPTKEQME